MITCKNADDEILKTKDQELSLVIICRVFFIVMFCPIEISASFMDMFVKTGL